MGIAELFKSTVTNSVKQLATQFTWKNNIWNENTGITTFMFPKELGEKNYEFRKLTIYVWKSKVVNEAFVSEKYKSKNGSNPSVINIDKIKGIAGDVINDGVEVVKSGADSLFNGGNNFYESIKGFTNNIGEMTGFDDFEGAEPECCFVLPIPLMLMEMTSHGYQSTDGIISSMLDVAKGTTDKLQQAVARKNAQKIMPNPDKFQNYQGSEPRNYDFTFKMVPSSSEDAAIISNIIFNLKKYASPYVDNGFQNLTMIQPRFFSMTFGNPVLNELIRPLPFVISDITLAYDDGTYVSTTLDGMPKVMTLTLRISEIRTMHQLDYDVDNSNSANNVSSGSLISGGGFAGGGSSGATWNGVPYDIDYGQ